MQDLQHFARASDYFLGKTTDEIAEVILHVLEAYVRDIYEHVALKYIEEGDKFSVPVKSITRSLKLRLITWIISDNPRCFPRNGPRNPCSKS